MVSVGSPSVGWEGRKPERKDSYCRKATSNKPVSLWDPSVRQLLGFAPSPQSPKNLLPPSLFNQSFFCKLKQSKPTRNEILNLILLESKRASPLVAFLHSSGENQFASSTGVRWTNSETVRRTVKESKICYCWDFVLRLRCGLWSNKRFFIHTPFSCLGS